MKKIAILLAALMVFTLCACGTKAATTTQAQGETQVETAAPETTETAPQFSSDKLVVALSAEPAGLIDCLAYNSNAGAVTSSLFDTLVWYNSSTGEVEPMMAESWELEDETTLIIHLKQNIKDFEGNPITANDVLWSFQQSATQPATSAYTGYYDLENSEVIDDYTLKLKTFSAYSQILNSLCNKAFAVMSKTVTDAAGGLEACLTTAANGTGMYKIESWTNGENMIIVRNENYYGEPGYFEKIEFKFIPDGATRAMALQSGDVDFVYALPASVAETISGTEGLEFLQVKAPMVLCLGMNIAGENAKYMSMPEVRMAISMCINKEAILAVAHSNYGEVADSIFPSHYYLYQAPSPEKTIPYDVEGAKKLLESAGIKEGEITLNLLVNAVTNSIDAEVLQNNLKDIGINVNMNLLDIPSWIAEKDKGLYDLFPTNVYCAVPTDILKNIDGSCTYASRNITGVHEEEADKLVAAASSALELADQKVAFKNAIDYMVYDKNVLVPICTIYSLFGAKQGLGNVYVNTQGDHAFYCMIRPE